MIGREKCILPAMMIMSNVHARKSFFFAPYRPNSPNKILGPGSSIIVKMMDERCNDLPSNFPQFHFLPPIYSIKYILLCHRTTTTADFLFSDGRFVCCPKLIVFDKKSMVGFLSAHPMWTFILFQIFFFHQNTRYVSM